MSDAVERVARFLASLCYDNPDEVIQRDGGQDDIHDVRAWHHKREDAKEMIAKFAEQGIPIDKLLSGEMKAVDKNWLDQFTGWLANSSSPVEPEFAKALYGNRSEMYLTDDQTKQAQLDYRLNADIVTPERAQEPIRATHSEKWTLTGPAQPPEE